MGVCWLVLLAALLGAALCEAMNQHRFLPDGVTAELVTEPKDVLATQALPQAWVAYGWAKHRDGRCSYKGYIAQHCPDQKPQFWDSLLNNPAGRFDPVVPQVALWRWDNPVSRAAHDLMNAVPKASATTCTQESTAAASLMMAAHAVTVLIVAVIIAKGVFVHGIPVIDSDQCAGTNSWPRS